MNKLTEDQVKELLTLAEFHSEDIDVQYYGEIETHKEKFIALQELRYILTEMSSDDLENT